MTTTNPNVTKFVSRDIPLNKLVPAPDNVRKTPRPGAVEERAASILAHGLLQNLTARPQLDEDRRETGKYEVIAGCTRLAALKLLASRKKIAKNAPIPCNVREDGIGTELSLAENVGRDQLHPADEFEAFRDLAETGLGADDIAARFGVTPRVVKERLKLGAVSPVLMQLYRQGGLALDQLMAFTVTGDHRRQEEVWEGLSYDKSPGRIRRTLLESHIPASDRRARFVTLAAYEAAGGVIVRDLFSEDGGGYLADAALLDRLARTKLEAAADAVRSEGWKWIETALDFPHNHGLARVYPRNVDLPDAEAARLDEIEAELDGLYGELEQATEPDPELEQRVAALNAEYEGIDAKQRVYDPAAVARSGAFVCIGQDGTAEIVRGFVRPEDMPAAETEQAGPGEATDATEQPDEAAAESEDDGPSRLSGALIADLSAQRTMALRDMLAAHPDTALQALTHALALDRFYLGAQAHSCLRIRVHSTPLETSARNIGASPAGRSIEARQEAWAARMPDDPGALWTFVLGLSAGECAALLAHCVASAVDAVETGANTGPALAHAQLLAQCLTLDMRRFWTATTESYLGRVPKALIVEAISEGVSSEAAGRIAGLKKAEMAQAAEDLLQGTGWLPIQLRPRVSGISAPALRDDARQVAE